MTLPSLNLSILVISKPSTSINLPDPCSQSFNFLKSFLYFYKWLGFSCFLFRFTPSLHTPKFAQIGWSPSILSFMGPPLDPKSPPHYPLTVIFLQFSNTLCILFPLLLLFPTFIFGLPLIFLLKIYLLLSLTQLFLPFLPICCFCNITPLYFLHSTLPHILL